MMTAKPATRIVCFGDSLVEGEGDVACQGGWVGRLAAVLKPNHGNFGGYRIFNLGIGGATAVDLRMRFGEAVICRPDILIIGCFSNDFLIRPAAINPSGIDEHRVASFDMQRAWNELLGDATKLCDKVLIVGSPRDYSENVSRQRSLPYGPNEHKAFIRSLCERYKAPQLLDYPSFVNESDVRTEFDHPNAKGYDLMFKDIYAKLQQLKWVD